MPFPYQDETKELNDATRKEIGGSFIALPNGITHYELSSDSPLHAGRGPEGRDVVLVHGFSVPMFIFDPLFSLLTQSDFRVLRYDQFGRGFSNRPHTRYNIDLFDKQLYDLLDVLRLTSPVNLIGLSMGGPIAATFTTRHPERVRSLTLFDPSGVKSISLTPLLKMAKVPIVAEAVFGWMGTEKMIEVAKQDFFDPKLMDVYIDRYRIQMQYKGFKRALLSSVRNNMLDTFVNAYGRVGKMETPVQLFWGRDDATVPFEHSADLQALIPNAEFHAIENCGHVPFHEKPDEVGPILLRFLRKL